VGTFDKPYFSLRTQLKFTLTRECVHVKVSLYFCRQNAGVFHVPLWHHCRGWNADTESECKSQHRDWILPSVADSRDIL